MMVPGAYRASPGSPDRSDVAREVFGRAMRLSESNGRLASPACRELLRWQRQIVER